MPATAAPDARERRGLAIHDLKVEHPQQHGEKLLALSVSSFTAPAGSICGFTGASGSGKTTLLHVVAGLLRPSAGRVLWDELDVGNLPETRRDEWRRQTIGFIFQDFHLVPELSVLDNVLLPIWFGSFSIELKLRRHASELLKSVGLDDVQRRAGVLSRGEQQRVAIARALLGSPSLILADEPTASLDRKSGEIVSDLLLNAARCHQATMLVVSHDPRLLARLDRVEALEAGCLTTVESPT